MFFFTSVATHGFASCHWCSWHWCFLWCFSWFYLWKCLFVVQGVICALQWLLCYLGFIHKLLRVLLQHYLGVFVVVQILHNIIWCYLCLFICCSWLLGCFFVSIWMLFDPTHGAFHVVACIVVLFMVWLMLLFVTQFVMVLVALLECIHSKYHHCFPFSFCLWYFAWCFPPFMVLVLAPFFLCASCGDVGGAQWFCCGLQIDNLAFPKGIDYNINTIYFSLCIVWRMNDYKLVQFLAFTLPYIFMKVHNMLVVIFDLKTWKLFETSWGM